MKKRLVGFALSTAIAISSTFGGLVIPFNITELQAAEIAPAYRNVMYYGEWSIYAGQNYFYSSLRDGSQITHLNFTFLDMDQNGDLILCDEHADFQAILPEQTGLTYGEPYAGVLGEISILRSKYPNMKIGISVGGWTKSGDFATVAADVTKRTNFAKNIAKFVDYLGYDFVDIDWEYPTAVKASDPAGNGVTIDEGCLVTAEDTQNFTLLLQAIRDELDILGKENNKYYELSVAMSASPAMMSKIEYDSENAGTTAGTYAAWTEGASYNLGDLVVYEGKVYECTYAHTQTHIGWAPGVATTLWKERTDLVAGSTVDGSNSGETNEDESNKNDSNDNSNENDEINDEVSNDKNSNNGNNENVGTTAGTYAAWTEGASYNLGDLVVYEGKVYECTYAHTQTHIGWAPGVATTLWKERTDLVAGNITEGNNSSTTDGTESGKNQTENNYYVNGKLPQHMVTGYWHNFVNGSANLKLSDVPTYYDMICVAFTGNTATKGEVTFALDEDLCRALRGYTKDEFIQDIKDLKKKGQHVIISVGGAEGRIEIDSQEASDLFAESLINIIEEYGFEGVDIDLEGAAVSGVDYIADALRKVHDHFGDDFIITMAPETFYIQADRLSAGDITTSYLRLALEIQDILTICYPQFYNSGGMNGYNGTVVNPGSADFLTSLSTLIIEAGLRPDQVALGVPSTTQAAGSGYIAPSVVADAAKALANGTSSGNFTAPKAYPTIRGVMTWSINWDATNDYAWAKAMDDAMDELPQVEINN